MTKVTNLPFSADVLALNPALVSDRDAPYRTKADRILKSGDDFDSELERDFYVELATRPGITVLRKFWTFNLPGGVSYTPDFLTWFTPSEPGRLPCDLTIYECKGHAKQKNARDSWTRFRIASGMFPIFTFVLVMRTPAGSWTEDRYVSTGTVEKW